jgi:hypothetical protein
VAARLALLATRPSGPVRVAQPRPKWPNHQRDVACAPVVVTTRWPQAPNYVELISQYDSQRGSIDHIAPHRLDQNHTISNQTIPSSQKRIPDCL